MILGFMPSMSATAELVVPRSIPITGPLTFSSLSIFSAYDLLNDELMGALYAEERRVDVARGAALRMNLVDSMAEDNCELKEYKYSGPRNEWNGEWRWGW